MRREMVVPAAVLAVLCFALPLFAQLPAGWTGKNVGTFTPAGSVQYDKDTDTWTIQGAGTGIRGTADQFFYVYKSLSGDGELIARVVSIDPPLADWTMAGVMIRVTLDTGSPYIFMGMSANTDTKDHGITMWGREAFGAAADTESTGAETAPYWVKVKRTGNTFAAYSSPNGKDWTERYSTDVAGIPPNTYIGYAVASEVAGQLVTAVMDKGPVKATEPSPADGAVNVAAPLLRWTPGVTATVHSVYFGTNPTPGAAEYQTQFAVTSSRYFHGPGLEPATMYFWRIDETGADGKTVYTGDVWQFTSAPATAYAPEPWDGLEGVGVEADLAWTPGMNAVSHDVYFGTDKAAVAAGETSTFKGNQLMISYDPGTLAENMTYWWRVDERDAADAVQKGRLWSFRTVGPGLGVKAEYFRGIELAGAPVLTQAENAIEHNWSGGELAPGLSDQVSVRWTADLKAPFAETYQLITTTDDGVRLWLDDRRLINNWTNHGSTDDTATVNLNAGQFYRLVMEYYENTGSAVAQLSWQSPSISRQIIPAGPLQLPVHATAPYPANLSTDTSQKLVFHWQPGEQATGHDVYFRTDAEAVANADTTTAGVYQIRLGKAETTFEPGELEWNKRYFWRIDEVNEASADSPWVGSVWSFTTADFLVVDDFESYTDDEGNRIYQAWKDGYSDDSSGSTVGHLDPPFAEQTVVHGGGQSMPLDYNNVNSPYFSEASREFSPVQDWTVNGVDTLVLYLRGKPDNVTAPLYVILESSNGKTAKVTHPDNTIVQTTTWTAWEIPLSQFTSAGVSATKIKGLYLGVGDPDHPAPGGHGVLFLDDIRVITP
jgi:hypothetical protein